MTAAIIPIAVLLLCCCALAQIPVVTSVSSSACKASGTSLAGCPSGAVLTVKGSGFSTSTKVYFVATSTTTDAAPTCAPLQLQSSTALGCTLSAATASGMWTVFATDQTFTTKFGGTAPTPRSVPTASAPPAPPDNGSTMPLWLLIVIIVVCVLLLVAIVLLLRWRSSRSQMQDDHSLQRYITDDASHFMGMSEHRRHKAPTDHEMSVVPPRASYYESGRQL
eukprot:TRINITY_DN99444_c0_g1_i1.p1 TRINITY_DN99444_c0_g1~~TRINITY_DN99444_c0_g1_i1.p1  ORF type:complete len:229 (-),score=23.76 TRINITY_DN99444_c0_g1_i1:118-783(-)